MMRGEKEDYEGDGDSKKGQREKTKKGLRKKITNTPFLLLQWWQILILFFYWLLIVLY